jgi:3-oxoacyl-[acyl-carrier-protein] synthase-1
MTDVFITADNIFSPLGMSSAENFAQLKISVSGVKRHDDSKMSEQPFYASLFDKQDAPLNDDTKNKFTKFETLLIASISDGLQNSGVNASDNKTILIISSTKGNIGLLESGTHSKELNKRIALTTSAKLVADHFHFVNQPIVISNACISGVLAIITGMRMIQSGTM